MAAQSQPIRNSDDQTLLESDDGVTGIFAAFSPNLQRVLIQVGFAELDDDQIRWPEGQMVELLAPEMDELARNWMRLRMGANDDTRNRG